MIPKTYIYIYSRTLAAVESIYLLTIMIIVSSNLNFLAFDTKDGPLTPEEEEQRSNTKRKVLGNIRFIGRCHKINSFLKNVSEIFTS